MSHVLFTGKYDYLALDFFAISDIFLLHLWDHFKGLQINKFLLHLIQLYRHNICTGIFIEWLVSQMFGYAEFSKFILTDQDGLVFPLVGIVLDTH